MSVAFTSSFIETARQREVPKINKYEEQLRKAIMVAADAMGRAAWNYSFAASLGIEKVSSYVRAKLRL